MKCQIHGIPVKAETALKFFASRRLASVCVSLRKKFIPFDEEVEKHAGCTEGRVKAT